MVPSLVDGLKSIARTRHHVAMYVANGYGAWEAALANTLRAGDKVLILSNGIFANGWAEMARCVGLDVEIIHSGKWDALDWETMKKRLGKDDHAGIKAVLAVHTNTSTGICNTVDAIRSAMDAVGHGVRLLQRQSGGGAWPQRFSITILVALLRHTICSGCVKSSL